MNQIYPDVGLIAILTRIVTPSLVYHLFTNNVVPDRDTELADLTEMAASGYVEIVVDDSAFTLDGVAGHVGSLLAAPIAFENTSGGALDAYGYFVTNVAGDELLAVARFDSAPVNKDDGQSWLVTPIVGDFSGLSS